MLQDEHDNLAQKDYNVRDYYHSSGFAVYVGTSNWFNNLTLTVILLNAIWIGVDAEMNTGKDAPLWLTIVDWVFFVFFTCEILLRFACFKVKLNCLRDFWFKFDGILVLQMIFDVIMSVPDPESSTGSVASLGPMLRLLRLARLARLVRLVRSQPELVTLMKGMMQAMRSVISAVLVLLTMLYVMGMIFRTQLGGPACKCSTRLETEEEFYATSAHRTPCTSSGTSG